jgi:hypothetical protein
MAECFFPKAITQSNEKHVSFTPPIDGGRKYDLGRRTKPVNSLLFHNVSAISPKVLQVRVAEFGLMFD